MTIAWAILCAVGTVAAVIVAYHVGHGCGYDDGFRCGASATRSAMRPKIERIKESVHGR